MFSKIKEKIPHIDAIAVSYGAMFVEGATTTILVALMSVLAQKFNKTNGDIATLISLKSLGCLLVIFISGKLSDKYGRKIPIFLGSILYAIFLVGFVWTSNFFLAIVFAFLAGVAHGLMDTPGMSLLFDSLSGNTGPALSLVQVFFTAGGVTSTLLAALFISNQWDFRLIFGLIFVINTLLFLLVNKTKYPPLAGAVEIKKQRQEFIRKPTMAKEGLFLVVNTLVYSSFQAIVSTWLPVYCETIKGFELADSVATLSFYQIGAVCGALFFAVLLRKIHSTQLLAFNPIICILALANLIFQTNHLLIIISIMLMGFLMGIFFSLSINMGGELFYDKPGTAAGVVASASMAGGTLVVWLTGRLIDQVGVHTLFVCALGCIIVLAVLTRLFKIHYKNITAKGDVE